jgi:mannose/fructose/N-acetylgalactosamine-specific phosphotransferase system component IIB
MKEAMAKAKEAGLDLGAVKQAAMKDFVTQGAAAGTISAEVAADFLVRAAQREKMQQVRESLEDAVAAAIAKALGLTAEELAAMDSKEGRQQLQEKAAAAGVDLKEVKSQAVDAFVQAAVAEGTLTEEEAAELQQRRGGHKGKRGARKGKKSGRKTGGFGQAKMKVRAGNKSGKHGKMARFAQRFNGRGQAPAAAPQQSASQDPVAPPGAAPQDATMAVQEFAASPATVAFRSLPAADTAAAANSASRRGKGGKNKSSGQRG